MVCAMCISFLALADYHVVVTFSLIAFLYLLSLEIVPEVTAHGVMTKVLNSDHSATIGIIRVGFDPRLTVTT